MGFTIIQYQWYFHPAIEYYGMSFRLVVPNTDVRLQNIPDNVAKQFPVSFDSHSPRTVPEVTRSSDLMVHSRKALDGARYHNAETKQKADD